jgi:hypothetical protein
MSRSFFSSERAFRTGGASTPSEPIKGVGTNPNLVAMVIEFLFSAKNLPTVTSENPSL